MSKARGVPEIPSIQSSNYISCKLSDSEELSEEFSLCFENNNNCKIKIQHWVLLSFKAMYMMFTMLDYGFVVFNS